MAKHNMDRVDVVKRGDRWVGQWRGGQTFAEGATKKDAVRNAAAKARKSSTGVSVRIHGKNGRIQEERTYPRGGDPRSSKS